MRTHGRVATCTYKPENLVFCAGWSLVELFDFAEELSYAINPEPKIQMKVKHEHAEQYQFGSRWLDYGFSPYNEKWSGNWNGTYNWQWIKKRERDDGKGILYTEVMEI